MSTFGCHSCGVDLQACKDKPYEEWPCAKCAVAKNYYHTFSTGYFDTASMEELEDESASPEKYNTGDADFVTADDLKLTMQEASTLRTLERAITNHVMTAFSGIIVKLLKLGKENPEAFEVFIKKMQFPYMSYSSIGESMTPKRSKQSVLYDLKTVIRTFPELEAVIMTDTRYSNGHFALHTLADKCRRQQAEERLQKIVFKDRYKEPYSIAELNKILHLPFNVDSDVFDFNAYLADDIKIHDALEDKD